ncbi:hypothetical protein HC928_09655 [bacterium]|nr:hypothetical protein [bacterium]
MFWARLPGCQAALGFEPRQAAAHCWRTPQPPFGLLLEHAGSLVAQDDQQCVRQTRQRAVPIPPLPPVPLVVIQPNFAFRLRNTLLHRPALACDLHKGRLHGAPVADAVRSCTSGEHRATIHGGCQRGEAAHLVVGVGGRRAVGPHTLTRASGAGLR